MSPPLPSRDDPEFDAIRASFIEMCRRDLPEGYDLAEFKRNPDFAFYLLMKLVIDAQAEGLDDPVPWFTAWCASCLDRPTFTVRLPIDKNKLN
jgi:hypothetical protein